SKSPKTIPESSPPARPPAGGSGRSRPNGRSAKLDRRQPSGKERELGNPVETLPCPARQGTGRPGPACRRGPPAQVVRHDEVQPDGRGLDQPRDRPPSERPERPRLG